MESWLVEETLLFLKACALGAVLGACYDGFRILRAAVRFHTVLVFVQDVLYFVGVTIVTFAFLLAYNDGELRMFILIGELMGAVLYFFSLSLIVMGLSKQIIRMVKRIFGVVFRPLLWILRKIGGIFRPLLGKCRSSQKKLATKMRFCLKNTAGLVYNRTESKRKDSQQQEVHEIE